MTRVVVTPKDIREGKRGSTTGCPVALALTRAFKTAMWATGMRYGHGSPASGAMGAVPRHVCSWINAFDLGLSPVKPIRFQLP